MIILSKQIKGHGRGHKIGFPTINLAIPSDMLLDDGIYAVWVVINDKTYKGAMHFGPVPTFGDKEHSLEVYLLDVADDNVPDTEGVPIEIDVVLKLRDVKKFVGIEDLSLQIDLDVKKIRFILK